MIKLAKQIHHLLLPSLAVLFAVALSSCRDVSHEQWQEQHDRYAAQHISKFHYEGHNYLLFQRGHEGVAITHDENCPCRNVPAAVGAVAVGDTTFPPRAITLHPTRPTPDLQGNE